MIQFLTKKRGEQGFTLIELLVVIAIIGVLASIVLASLNTARRRSRDARRIADVKQIQLGLELCFDARCANDGAVPPAVPVAEGGYPDEGATNAIAPLLAPNHISGIPSDPSGVAAASAQSYQYVNLESNAGVTCTTAGVNPCMYYHIGATLEDATNGAFNSDGDRGDNAAGAWGFDGNALLACGSAEAVGPVNQVGDLCYDVTP